MRQSNEMRQFLLKMVIMNRKNVLKLSNNDIQSVKRNKFCHLVQEK